MRRIRLLVRMAVVIVFTAPLVLMAVGAVSGLDLPPPAGIYVAPQDAGLDAFRRLPELLPLPTLLRNSLVVVALAVPITVLVSSWAGLAMALAPARARRALVGVTVALLVVPLPTVWVTRFVLYRWTGVLDSLVPMWAPALAATTPFTVLLAYRAFRRVAPELWEAARLEGSSALRAWWSIGLAQVRPTTAAIAALAFTAHWGNYLDGLLYVRSPELRTLAMGVAELRVLDPSDAPIALAGALVLTAMPLFLLGLVQNRLFSATER